MPANFGPNPVACGLARPAGQHPNTVLVRLPKAVSAGPLTSALCSAGWLVRAETEPPLSNHLRITIGPADQMKHLCQRIEPYLTGKQIPNESARPSS